MLVYLTLRDGSAQTSLRAATLRWKLWIKLSTSPSHSILTPGRPVPVPTLYHQVPGRVATEVPIFKSLVWFDAEKSQHKQDSNPGSSALKADALPLDQRGDGVKEGMCEFGSDLGDSRKGYIWMID